MIPLKEENHAFRVETYMAALPENQKHKKMTHFSFVHI